MMAMAEALVAAGKAAAGLVEAAAAMGASARSSTPESYQSRSRFHSTG